jgi:hypothetical protein
MQSADCSLSDSEEWILISAMEEACWQRAAQLCKSEAELLQEIRAREGPHQCLGDPREHKLITMLDSLQPYPGNRVDVTLEDYKDQFYAYQISDTEYVAHDYLKNASKVISIEAIEDHDFHIGLWYTCHCSKRSGEPIKSEKQFDATFRAYDLWAWNAGEILGLGQFYPGEPTSHSHIQPRDRFHIAWKATDLEIYCIHDSLLNFRTEIPASSLRNPKFDLVHWYIKQLLRSYHGLEQLMFPCEKNDDMDT